MIPFRQLIYTYDAPPWGVRASVRGDEVELPPQWSGVGWDGSCYVLRTLVTCVCSRVLLTEKSGNIFRAHGYFS